MKNDGASTIALEASSHGLSQRRLNGTLIDVAVFTNLTRDHLDYHETLADYQASKKSLFLQDGIQTAVINLDDAFGRQLSRELAGRFNILTYSTESTTANVSCADIAQSKTGVSAVIRTPWGTGLLSSGLYGIFNLSNLLAVVCVLGSEGFELSRILAVLSELKNVKGRMDRITLTNGMQVVIDYAHTPDALENVLKTLRNHCDGKLWCVFGCGGDRDKGKRSEMGRISVKGSDYVVLTDDNPRTESREQIIQDILSGIDDRSRVFVEADRGKAIRLAIQKAEPDDILLIAGKGHEDYQDVNGIKINYSDYEEVSLASD
jgi:UDP-N-acetylmuramoyl-L-alanyl-D-glutamate--2,6-diaminopimelate ligase